MTVKKILRMFCTVTMMFLLIGTSIAGTGEKIYFYHTDPAGTPMAISDDAGNIVWRATYKPFGQEHSVSGSFENNERFIGKEKDKDKETGLVYINHRYFKPEIGRFISPDEVTLVDPWTSKVNQRVLLNPQLLNRYAYGLNNPYRYKDANGQWPEQVHNEIIRNAFSGGGYNLSSSAIAGLMKGSKTADSSQYQDLAHSYMHAMRMPGQSAEEAAGLTVTFINQQVAEYKKLMAVGQEGKAYEALGMAMHPLMDATSPSHEGYQEWNSPWTHPLDARNHMKHETENVFHSNADYSRQSVNAIRKLYGDVTR